MAPRYVGAAVKLLTLNICHGGGRRDERIIELLRVEQPDVAVLTEYRTNATGTRLIKALATLGLQYVAGGGAAPNTNSIVLVARTPVATRDVRIALSPLHAHRLVLADVSGALVCGAYFPLNKAKEAFWRDEFLPFVRSLEHQPCVLIGDFNTGQHLVDEVGRTFFGAQYIDELRGLGWTDAWRSQHPDGREYSWFSKAGNGFRVDHCWLSRSMESRLIEARYVHSTRVDGTSDHSALVVTLRDD